MKPHIQLTDTVLLVLIARELAEENPTLFNAIKENILDEQTYLCPVCGKVRLWVHPGENPSDLMDNPIALQPLILCLECAQRRN